MPHSIIALDVSAPGYPARLRANGSAVRYPSLAVVGNPAILEQPLLGLLCSRRCPGRVIPRTYDLARLLRDAAIPVVGGFHSPMEKECLDLLLRGAQPIVICPARSIGRMRIPSSWRKGIDAGRVLIASPFDDTARRVTSDLAARRNRFVAELAHEVMLIHANPGGGIERLGLELASAGTIVWTLQIPENTAAIRAGARPTTLESFAPEWHARSSPLIANRPPSG